MLGCTHQHLDELTNVVLILELPFEVVDQSTSERVDRPNHAQRLMTFYVGHFDANILLEMRPCGLANITEPEMSLIDRVDTIALLV